MAPQFSFRWMVAGLLVLAVALPALSQNTKGDRPQPNQRQVRETRGKSIKQERAQTKDITGRRLRTKNKSSASRANASYPQVSPYRDRKRVNNDIPAEPRTRIHSKHPRERQRAWTGDVAGKPVRRVEPRKTEAAQNNVYPARGTYVNNPSRRPRERQTFRAPATTASGKPLVRRRPQPEARAWKGNLRGRPVAVRSATARTKNVYPQKGPYSAFGRLQKPDDRSRQYWNQGIVSQILSTPVRIIRGQHFSPSISSRSRVTPGRKNVYWGKTRRRERALATDLAGRPLRARNFRSATPGIARQDTLRDFRRTARSGRLQWNVPGRAVSATRGGRPWRGDLAGRPIRFRQPRTGVSAQIAGKPPSRPGLGVTGRLTRPGSVSGRLWNNRGQPIDINRAGPGTIRGAGFRGKIDVTRLRNYQDQGGMFSGYIKAGRPAKGGGSVSGKLWNNRGQPVDVNTAGPGTIRGSRFSGSIRTERPAKGGGSVSGKLWNNRGQPVDVNTAGPGTIRGSRFSGSIRTERPAKGGGSVSGKLWNNRGQPVDVNTAGPGTIRGSRFSGSIRTERPAKGGGSVSGKLWNNRGQPVDVNTAGMGTIRGSRFSGSIRSERPAKGGGSVSGRLWNNRGQPVDVNTAGVGTIRGSRYRGRQNVDNLWNFGDQGGEFSGFIKARKPEKGGGSVSGRLWNNNETPIDPRLPSGNDAKMAGYSGFIKARKQEKGGGSVSGKLWNNNETPIDPRLPSGNDAKMAGYSGFVKAKRGHQQNPNAHPQSIDKRTPTRNVAKAGGLQIRAPQPETARKEVAAEGVLPGLAPGKNLERAYRFAGGMPRKSYTQNPSAADLSRPVVAPSAVFRQASVAHGTRRSWNYQHGPSADEDAVKTMAPSAAWRRATSFQGFARQRFDSRHNPNSHELALDVRYYGKAYAKIERYRGEMKVVRYNDGRLHPDARFAHGRPATPPEGRSLFTQVQLWWAKNFRRSEAQPDHLKERVRKPRYDKREIGLWYD